MSRRTRWTIFAALALAALLAAWLLDAGDPDGTPVAPLERPGIDTPGAPRSSAPAPAPAPEPAAGDALARADGAEPQPLHARPAPVAAPAASDDALALRVRHAHGPPAAGARAGVQRDAASAWLAAGVLDAEGRFRTVAIDGPVELVVYGATREPARLALDAGRGEHELVLPEGAVLAGQVYVDGASPGAGFPVGVVGLRGPSKDLDGAARFPAFQPPGVVDRTYAAGVLTDAEGRFLVSGLPPDEAVELRWPRLHRLVASRSTPLPLPAPRGDVVLSLQAPRVLRGRVLHADGSPAADARMDATLAAERLEGYQELTPAEPTPPGTVRAVAQRVSTAHDGLPLDADGRFAVAIGDLLAAQVRLPPVEQGELTLHAIDFDVALSFACEHGSASVVAEDLDLARDHDLGDVLLAPTRRARLRVVDAQGSPLPDARVRVEVRRGGAPVLDVDAAGEVTFPLPADALGEVTVLAPDHESVRLEPLLAVEPDVQVVVLPRAAVITLELDAPWRTEEEREPWRLSVGLRAQGPAFQDATHPGMESDPGALGWDSLRDPPAVRGSTERISWADGTHLVLCELEGTTLRFEAVRAGHPLAAVVRADRAPAGSGIEDGAFIWESDALWLAPGEQRVLHVDLTGFAPGR